MAFCGKCGAQLAEDEKFCPNCGAAAEQGGTVVNKAKEVLNTEDTTGEYDPQDINANKGISVLSYLGILVLIPLLTKKDSKRRSRLGQGTLVDSANMKSVKRLLPYA